MGATLTKTGGPVHKQGIGSEFTFSIALDDSFAASGEPIDLSPYFSYVYGGSIGGVDAVADALYHYIFVYPGRSTAVTSSNCLIEVTRAPSATGDAENAKAFAEATSVNLSSVGALVLTVVGKACV